MLSYRKNFYFIPYFLHSLSIFSFCGLTPYLTLNYNLVYCLFPFHSPFCLICCLMATFWGWIRYLMHAERGTFTTSGSSPVNAVIFNSLIWHFTLFEAVFYGFHYYYYFYSNTRNRFYWVSFSLEDIHRPKFCTMTLSICHYTDFGNSECRPRIGLFTPFKNKFQWLKLYIIYMMDINSA